jgi:trk system potassium uptake protein TrkH
MNEEPPENQDQEGSRVWTPQKRERVFRPEPVQTPTSSIRSTHTKLRRQLPIALRLVIGLLILVAVGTALLLMPGVTTRQLSLREALFTATSALTVTGLGVITPAIDLTIIGQFILMVLVQIGGVGFMVLAVVAFQLIGRRIQLADRLALRDSLGLIDVQSVVRLTWRVLQSVLIIELIGAIFLWLNWRNQLGDGLALFYGMFHAITAFCNAGFDLFIGLPGYSSIPNDNATLLILSSLIVIGGLGIPVIGELLRYYRDRAFSLHTRLTLAISLVLLVVGTLGFFISETRAEGTIMNEPWYRQLLLSYFQSASSRTAGFAAFAGFENQNPATQLLTVVLMFIGCAPASMGGGITTGTFVVLMVALWSNARGETTVTVWGRTIPQASIQRAGAVLTISLFVVLFATWLILVSHPTATTSQALFEVVSAFATCGLSLAFTSQLNWFGQLVIILVMFWGRLGAMTVIVALARPTAPTRVTYPEEQLLMG